MTTSCMVTISFVTVMVNKLWSHHSWINLWRNEYLLLLLLLEVHLRIVWKIPLVGASHKLRKHFILIHMLPMALTVLKSTRRMCSSYIMCHLKIRDSIDLMTLVEGIVRWHDWLVCLDRWILKDLRNSSLWIMYTCWTFSFANLLSNELDLTALRSFETLICYRIHLFIKG